MPFAAVAAAAIGAGGSILAGSEQAGAAKKASNTQLEMFHEMQKTLAPFVTGGEDALSALTGGLGIQSGNLGAGPLSQPFSWQDFMKSPGYDFMKEQGTEAITNSAAARGGVFGGNTLKALDEFGTGLAAQEYWNARNAYDTEQQQRINNLLSLSGLGESAAANVGSGALSTGANLGNIALQAGNAQSATTGALANTLSNFFQNPAVSGGINDFFMNQIMGTLSGQQAGDVISQNPNLF